MTGRRKIIINIMATYGRSLYALLVGIFTARWVLMALGKSDYGLVGVVGCMAWFVSFLNGLLSYAVSRFYAVSVGAASRSGQNDFALQDCQKWFNAALSLHTGLSLILVIIGYPIGIWAIQNFLTVPMDRIDACCWIWRFTCASCFVGMASVPFNAMYTAKQDIAELTIYGFCTTTLNAVFLYYIVNHPGFWLVRYSLWTCVMSAAPSVIQMVRAWGKYPECRMRLPYLVDVSRIRQIVSFGMARFWTALSSLLSGQGNAILVNKFLGPVFNSSMSLGNTVVSHVGTLSNAMIGAFWPAIANKSGAGEVVAVRTMSFQVCRFGTLLILIFAVPLALEIDEVMLLWLKNPPPGISALCVAILIQTILTHMTEGLYMPIMASGKGVAYYSWIIGWCGFSNFGMALLLMCCGMGFPSIYISIIVSGVMSVVIRVILGQKLAGMSARRWTREVLLPLSAVAILSVALGLLTRLMVASFTRVCLTTFLCEVGLIPAAWFLALRGEERLVLILKLKGIVKWR